MKKNLIGKKVKVKNTDIEGIIIVYDIDNSLREVIRLNITKGNTAMTDYYLNEVEFI